MQIELPQGMLRPWHPDDVGALVRHADNRNIWRNLRDRFPHPYTAEAAATWVHIANDNPAEPAFAIVVNGAAVGGIGLILGQDIDRRAAEIGYWLARNIGDAGSRPQRCALCLTTRLRNTIWRGFGPVCLSGTPAPCASWKRRGSRAKEFYEKLPRKTGKPLMLSCTH